MKKIITLFSFCLFAGMVTMNAQALKVIASGNVGINNAAPAEKLDVSGFITLSSPETGGSNFQNRNHVVYGFGGKKRLQFSTNASTLDSWAFIQMFGDETCSACPGTTRRGEMALGGQYMKFYTGNDNTGFGTLAAELEASGDLRVTGDVFAKGIMISSDKRLKKNIKNFGLGLEQIMQIEPKQYEYNGKDGFKNTSDAHFGVIAQELQKIVPQAVVSYKVDDERTNVHGEYLAVNEGMIKFMLINAIKDQQGIIDEQNDRIARLEGLVEGLASGDINTSEISLSNSITGELAQNAPNPFNGSTTIDYVVPANASSATINIFDMNGSLLRKVDVTHQGKGTLTINASDIPSGTYTYNLVVDGSVIGTNKMILQK